MPYNPYLSYAYMGYKMHFPEPSAGQPISHYFQSDEHGFNAFTMTLLNLVEPYLARQEELFYHLVQLKSNYDNGFSQEEKLQVFLSLTLAKIVRMVDVTNLQGYLQLAWGDSWLPIISQLHTESQGIENMPINVEEKIIASFFCLDVAKAAFNLTNYKDFDESPAFIIPLLDQCETYFKRGINGLSNIELTPQQQNRLANSFENLTIPPHGTRLSIRTPDINERLRIVCSNFNKATSLLKGNPKSLSDISFLLWRTLDSWSILPANFSDFITNFLTLYFVPLRDELIARLRKLQKGLPSEKKAIDTAALDMYYLYRILQASYHLSNLPNLEIFELIKRVLNVLYEIKQSVFTEKDRLAYFLIDLKKKCRINQEEDIQPYQYSILQSPSSAIYNEAVTTYYLKLQPTTSKLRLLLPEFNKEMLNVANRVLAGLSFFVKTHSAPPRPSDIHNFLTHISFFNLIVNTWKKIMPDGHLGKQGPLYNLLDFTSLRLTEPFLGKAIILNIDNKAPIRENFRTVCKNIIALSHSSSDKTTRLFLNTIIALIKILSNLSSEWRQLIDIDAISDEELLLAEDLLQQTSNIRPLSEQATEIVIADLHEQCKQFQKEGETQKEINAELKIVVANQAQELATLQQRITKSEERIKDCIQLINHLTTRLEQRDQQPASALPASVGTMESTFFNENGKRLRAIGEPTGQPSPKNFIHPISQQGQEVEAEQEAEQYWADAVSPSIEFF